MQENEIVLEDGRKAKRVIKEELDETTGEVRKTIELWAEPVIEKKLSTRVVEVTKPVVYRREIETLDGETVVDRKVESLEPDVKMELREHIAVPTLESQSTTENCYVTKEELKDILLSVMSVAPKAPSISMQEVVAERVEKSEQSSLTEMINNGVKLLIAAEAIALVYIWFFM